MSMWSTYPYLCLSLLLFVPFGIGLAVFAEQRRPMLLSALLSAPYAFLSVFFVPLYWNPIRLGAFGAGIEDILFSFANGGTVWFLATWPVRHRLVLDIQLRRVSRRYVGFSLSAFFLAVVVLRLLFDDLMHGTVVGMAVVAIALLRLRGGLWPVLVAGGLLFGLFYTVFCSVSFALHPSFLTQWNLDSLSGHQVLGVPVEEVAWSVGFGAIWPLMIAYAFDARLLARDEDPTRAPAPAEEAIACPRTPQERG